MKLRATIVVISGFILLGVAVTANASDIDTLLEHGRDLHDKGKYKEAIAKYKEVLVIEPAISSPYYLLAESFRSAQYRMPALCFYIKFLMFEPVTPSSIDAAQKVFPLLYEEIEYEIFWDKIIFYNPNPSNDEGDFTGLELALSLTIRSTYLGEDNEKQTLDHHVGALEDFAQICLELKDENLPETFTWKNAMQDIIHLHGSGNFSTFAYFVAAKAGIDGADQWVKNNPDKIAELDRAIDKTSPEDSRP